MAFVANALKYDTTERFSPDVAKDAYFVADAMIEARGEAEDPPTIEARPEPKA
jgi:hypothetical protein